MARNRSRRSSGTGAVTINMTPMIDCTFLLIIFFILTTQIVNADVEKIVGPQSKEPQAEKPEKKKETPLNIAIINVVSSEKVEGLEWSENGLVGKNDSDKARQISHYSISGERIESHALKTRLPVILEEKKEIAKKAGYEELILQVRGDARLPYSYVSAVFLAANRAGIKKMNLTTLVK